MKHIQTDSVEESNVKITQTHDIKSVCMWKKPSSADLVDWLTYLGVTAWSLHVCTWICRKNACARTRASAPLKKKKNPLALGDVHNGMTDAGMRVLVLVAVRKLESVCAEGSVERIRSHFDSAPSFLNLYLSRSLFLYCLSSVTPLTSWTMIRSVPV